MATFEQRVDMAGRRGYIKEYADEKKISGIDASKIGLNANPYRQKQTQATRFLDDFGRLKPKTVLGNEFLKTI